MFDKMGDMMGMMQKFQPLISLFQRGGKTDFNSLEPMFKTICQQQGKSPQEIEQALNYCKNIYNNSNDPMNAIGSIAQQQFGIDINMLKSMLGGFK